MLLYVFIGLMLIFIIDTLVLPVENDQTNKISYINDENSLDITTRPNHNESTIQQNDDSSYKQRSKTTSVLISIYFGIFGIDWFYLSRGNIRYIIVGICKLLVSCGCCSGWPILMFGTRRFSRSMIMIGYAISILFTLISVLWWVIDWTRMLINKFPDGNDIELKHFPEYF